MPKRERSATSSRSPMRRGEWARGRSTPREPARGEVVVGQERAVEAAPPAEAEETQSGLFERAAATTLTHEQIASRAKEVWERRRRPRGKDEQIWREAKEQLKQKTGAPGTSRGRRAR